MKIWKSFAGEHSANLRIVGTFKTEKDAQKAANCFNDLLDVEHKNKGENLYFSDEISEIMTKHHFQSLNENDIEQLDYFDKMTVDNNGIIVNTNELEIQVILKTLLRYGAKIEVYSKDNY